MTGYSEFPDDIQEVIDLFEEDDFDVIYGEVEGEFGGPGFIAERDDIFVQVTDRTQTWFVTLRGSERPLVEDSWSDPSKVVTEIMRWMALEG